MASLTRCRTSALNAGALALWSRKTAKTMSLGIEKRSHVTRTQPRSISSSKIGGGDKASRLRAQGRLGEAY